MRIFIAGIDGYIGWPLALHLKGTGHIVTGCDNLSRRERVAEVRSQSAMPIITPEERQRIIPFTRHDLSACKYVHLVNILREFRPDTIVHLAEQPSAPYSMIDSDHAIDTQRNNVMGTLRLLYAMKEACPDTHLLKLGTMGEYGTPNVAIPEGFFDVEYRGRKDTLPFPRQAGSWYHWSKVHDSNNVMFACRMWGLRSTDVMQGVVFGTRSGDATTRFDIDECFGTAINRFCAQAVIGHPLTVYGTGQQQRGFLPLRDSIQCLTLAIEKPPRPGEYRVLNQFENVYSIIDLAKLVQSVGRIIGLHPEIAFLPNPRFEAAEHYYEPDHQKLFDMGYKPSHNIPTLVEEMLGDLLPYRDRIEAVKDVLMPKTVWAANAVTLV